MKTWTLLAFIWLRMLYIMYIPSSNGWMQFYLSVLGKNNVFVCVVKDKNIMEFFLCFFLLNKGFRFDGPSMFDLDNHINAWFQVQSNNVKCVSNFQIYHIKIIPFNSIVCWIKSHFKKNRVRTYGTPFTIQPINLWLYTSSNVVQRHH